MNLGVIDETNCEACDFDLWMKIKYLGLPFIYFSLIFGVQMPQFN